MRFVPSWNASSLLLHTAAAAPLLGLLGTVTGMINTFKLITVFGTGDASNLVFISQALVTTELGLTAVAHHPRTVSRQKLGDLEQIAGLYQRRGRSLRRR